MTFSGWWSNLRRHLAWFRPSDQDLAEEVESTFDLIVEEKLRAGMTPAAARRAAAIEFGGVEQVKEQIRVARAGALVDGLVRDLQHAARMLARSPGFTVTAVVTLAIGIAANTTIFSFVYASLLKPLPLGNLPRLVSVYMTDARNPGERGVSRQNYMDFRDRADALEALTAEGGTLVNLADGTGEPERVWAELVTGNFFTTLGTAPIVGRGFRPDEDRVEGAAFVTVLSYPVWQKRFGGDPGIVGRTISVNRHPFTVVGVMPATFRGTQQMGGPALWMPLMTYPVTTTGQTLQGLASRRYDWLLVTGLLKPHVTAIARQLEQAYPNDNAGRSAGVRRLGVMMSDLVNDPQRRNVMTSVGLLMTTVGLVLFIGCANVANLMLTRATARQREMAIRQALGASRGRLLRQLLTEGVLLAGVSGLVGLLLARWAQALLWSYRPQGMGPNDLDLGVNGPVLAFTTFVSLATCAVFGVIPALRASRPDLVRELKGLTGRMTRASRWFNLRHGFIACQVALSLIALISAGLFVRSFQTLQQMKPGFDVTQLAQIRFDVGSQGYGEPQGREFQRAVVERVASLGGVDSVALADLVPLLGGAVTRTVFIEGEDLKDRRNGRIMPTGIISPGYFKTLGIPVVRGRPFDDRDQATAPLVAMVNERLARQLWPGQEPLGKRVKLFNTEFTSVVGVVADTKYGSLGNEPPPILYRPLAQVYQPGLSLLVRTANPNAILGNVRSQVQALDRKLPLGVSTLSDEVYGSLWTPRMAAGLLTLLGVVSLLLAVFGIYGVMAYSVGQRTRELGLRVALGADRHDVVRLVVGEGLRTALVGIAAGLTVAFATTRVVAGLLYGSATDPLTFITVPAILTAAVLAASYLPARHASRIEPTIALRADG
jgi:predicted permease